MADRPRVGLVLGGGGARGFAHVGVLKVLEENHVDMVFLEVEMPGWDGVETAARIRARFAHQEFPLWIVGLSANVLPETKVRAREAGMNDFLSKPVRPHQIAEAINRRIT